MKRRDLLVGATTLAALPAWPLQAQLRVDVSKGSIQPIDIALSPLAGATPADNQLGPEIMGVAREIFNRMQRDRDKMESTTSCLGTRIFESKSCT